TNNPPTNILNGADLGNVTSYTPAGPFNFSQQYYWRIEPYNTIGSNTGCDTWSFTTINDPTVTTFPWVEPFVLWPPQDWDLSNGPYYWIQYGNYCAECPVRDMVLNASATMTTPPLDISSLTNPELTFQWSHYFNPSAPADILEVFISTNGGSSWTSIWLKAGPLLNSNDGAGPDTPGTFVEETVNLSAYNTKGTVYLRFKGTSGLGSDIFVNYVLVDEGPQIPVCSNPVNPVNGETDVSVNTDIEWDYVTGANGYLLFFGTDNPPANIENGTDLGNVSSYTPSASLNNNQMYYWQIVPYNSAGNATSCGIWNFTTEALDITLDLKAYLEGPFNGSTMNTDLNGGGMIPLSQPYDISPWNYTGTESVTSIPNAIVVDWILLELRDAANAISATSVTIFDQKACFVLNNGLIRDIDGSSLITFTSSYSQNLFVVLWHRNHIGIMSAVPLTESGGVYSYDFSSGSGRVFGGMNAHKEISPGIWGMFGADGDANEQINNGDKNDVWSIQAGSSGYNAGDFNMDVQVNNGDKNDVWVPNTGLGGQVPN
ncbi:MAG: Ig-like domain-containing protein, partial [Bacteroidales bacterium]|nr:Ig-like domain-containing protein [Bacteroidales bacterium]